MCAIVSLENTRDFLTKNKRRKTVKVYKNLCIYNNILSSPVYKHYWKNGENKSNSRAGLQKKGFKKIRRGIHCYLNRNYAELLADRHEIVVEFTAKIEDLICIDDDVGVFTKVHLSKTEYNKAINSQ